MSIISVEEGIEQLRQGKMIIVIDDEDRENEGDFVVASDRITPEQMNFITKYGRGLVCVTITEDRAKALGLKPMAEQNTAPHHTNFTEAVDARGVTTTGISAYDRVATIKKLIDPLAVSSDFVKPGHMFPLVAQNGGVLKRAGHTEAVTDLCRISGLNPSGVLCEILDDDGSMARLPRLKTMSDELNIAILTIRDLIEYRRKREKLVEQVLKVKLPTLFGDFDLYLYEDTITGENHLAMVKGDDFRGEEILVRVHSQCMTGDIFHSLRCDCGLQLETAMQMIEEKGKGVILYMFQEGRGIGLKNKLKAYHLQEKGYDTVEANEKLGFKADLRDYGIGAQMLVDLGVEKICLMTNNPKKVIGLEGYGLKIVQRIPIEVGINPCNIKYMTTKKEKMGHLLQQIEQAPEKLLQERGVKDGKAGDSAGKRDKRA